MRHPRLLVAIAVLGGAIPCGGGSAVAQSPAADRAVVRELLGLLGRGSQDEYERFIERHWSPAALQPYPAEDHASALARIFADTRGFTAESVVGAAPGWIQALGRARLTGVRHCITVHRDSGGITDVGVQDLYPAGPGLPHPTPREVIEATEATARALDAAGELSGVILIAKDGRLLFRRAYGKASLAYDRPMTLSTRLNTASIGKSFTAVAIAQLIEAGKLSLDDTVGAVLADYPDTLVRDRVTIRQLLTHTAGLGEHYDHPKWPILRFRLRSVADYLSLVVGRPLVAEPGAKYEYSNSGYIVLGAIVEKLSGVDFYSYVRDHVFHPAGMTRTSYPMADEEEPGLATPLTNFTNRGETGYLWRLGGARNAIFEHAARGGPQGGAYSTADDLLAFDVAFRAAQLTSPAMVTLMTSAQGPSVGGRRGSQPETATGLGFEITRRNGHTMVGHQGGDLGVASWFYHFPETGYTMVGMTNRDPRAARVLLQGFRGLVTRTTLGGAAVPPQDCVPPS